MSRADTPDQRWLVAERLMKNNPRLSADKAHFLAGYWSAPGPGGRYEILGDPAHKIVNAHLFRVDEVLALYARITAPTLVIHGADDPLVPLGNGEDTAKKIRGARLEVIPGMGHDFGAVVPIIEKLLPFLRQANRP